MDNRSAQKSVLLRVSYFEFLLYFITFVIVDSFFKDFNYCNNFENVDPEGLKWFKKQLHKMISRMVLNAILRDNFHPLNCHFRGGKLTATITPE